MRHTITVTIEVESDSADKALVTQELLSHITDMQGQVCESSEVLPSGDEIGLTECTLSVAWAEAGGMKTTAGWAEI